MTVRKNRPLGSDAEAFATVARLCPWGSVCLLCHLVAPLKIMAVDSGNKSFAWITICNVAKECNFAFTGMLGLALLLLVLRETF